MKIGPKKETSIAPVSKNNKTLRTNIPANIRDLLLLQKGDTLEWQGYIENEKIHIKLTKKEAN